MTWLPHLPTDAAFEQADPTIDYAPALGELAKRHGIVPGSRFGAGSRPVFEAGHAVVKLYPAVDADAFERERLVLRALEGRLPFGTPQIEASGTLDSWSYLVMTRLEGRPLRDETVTPAEGLALMNALGRATAELHSVSHAVPGPDWPHWVEERRAGCAAWHRKRGAAQVWCDRIDAYLARWVPTLAMDGDALLHTEIMREHVFVQRTARGLELVGLLDFEPSWQGPVGYEFASVGLFTAEGEPGWFGAFLDGYGFSGDRVRLAHQTMAWALLHRYAHLGWWLSRSAPRSPRRDFDDLAREWFG